MTIFKSSVPRLDDLAFKASFRDIVVSLLVCPDHRPGGDRWSSAKSSSLISNHNELSTSDNIRQVVRARLDQHLVGTFNDEIR